MLSTGRLAWSASWGSYFCPRSAWQPPHDRVGRSGGPILIARSIGASQDTASPAPTPHDGTRLRWGAPAGRRAQAVAGSSPQRNSPPSRHIRWRTTACWTMWQTPKWLWRAGRARVHAEDHAYGVIGHLDTPDEGADALAHRRPVRRLQP